jgi:hypothetical protein
MCFKIRRKPAIAVSFLSAVVFIFGVTIAALAINFALADSMFTIEALQGQNDINLA